MAEVCEELAATYTDDGVAIWLGAHNRTFGHERPIDVCQNGDGRRRVFEQAENMAGGPRKPQPPQPGPVEPSKDLSGGGNGHLTDCRQCGHPLDHHDAGECWTDAHGSEVVSDSKCRCGWYEPGVLA